MKRILGVETPGLWDKGRFNPPVHRGLDVPSKPGSPVVVPYRSRLEIVETSFNSALKGQARGWIRICGDRYGFVAAHLAREPEAGIYREGEQYGTVAGRVEFTPHVHIALAKDHMPPPGDVDPLEVWKACLDRT